MRSAFNIAAVDEMEKLEEELRASRFQRWEVEDYLAARCRARMQSLDRGERFAVLRELSDLAFNLLGKMTAATLFGLWVLHGFPLPYS